MRISRDWLLVLGALLVIAALYNHYLGHSAYLVEIILVAVGSGLGIYSLRGLASEDREPDEGILTKVLARFISTEQSGTLIPLLGLSLIVAWSVWKLFVKHSADMQMEDFIVTLFGLSLVLYHAGPSRYAAQKDFVVLYLLFLTIVFAVIWKLYTILSGESYFRITAYSEYYFITLPVVFLVRMLGVDADAELDMSGSGLSNLIVYEYKGSSVWLGIGTGCSGLYSAGLFFSAFLAFVLVRYKKVDRYIVAASAMGLAVTWFSNIIRMVITILVGSLYGHPALVVVHSYIGILIFVAFVILFWFPIVSWLDRVEKKPEMREPAENTATLPQS